MSCIKNEKLLGIYMDEKSLQTDFLESVVKYVKIDDIVLEKKKYIKEKMKKYKEEIKSLEETKSLIQKSIIEYLDKKAETQINIGDGNKITKKISETKGTIKKTHITDGIFEGLEASVTNEEERKVITETIYKIINSKRPIKQREYLQRSKKREIKKP